MHPLATPALLSALRNTPNLPANSWYYLSSVAFALLNHPSAIPHIYTTALSTASDDEGASEILAKSREALLKASAIGGLPSTINALHALKSVVASDLLDAPSPTSRADRVLSEAAGAELWDSIYGKLGGRVMSALRRSYDDLGTVARLVYAGVLAEEKILGRRETGWVLVAGLRIGGAAWESQRKGHRRGVVNNGGSWEEVEAVERLAERILDEVRKAGGLVGRMAVPGEGL
ncbi:hypothetical protein FN846DRAFT_943385 [Sphaerosporella brunnea]|uniref:AhpD-like protein n=1 Tax=Sphaerosporella brunnea TaxID=1250544 RepID=A0A5J5F0J1_9PEZI|nr:hypothetical protein FN846DRAFT_943385 [Sphaerosporella brunnea]